MNIEPYLIDGTSFLFLGILGDIIGGFFGMKAADKQADAAKSAAKMQSDAAMAGLDFQKQTQAKIDAQTKPALDYLGRIIATPTHQMTPGQYRALEESKRSALNTLNRSGLRGSGRAMSAVLRDVDTSMRENMLRGNQSRADSAASGLAAPYFTSNLATAGGVAGALNSAAQASAAGRMTAAQAAGAGYGHMGNAIGAAADWAWDKWGTPSTYGGDGGSTDLAKGVSPSDAPGTPF